MMPSLMPGWLVLQRSARRMRTTFLETSLAHATWERSRRAASRWAWVGVAIGGLLGLAAFAPAAWLASSVASASGGRLLLADARGTLWAGSAMPLLTGGLDSRDAIALPDRVSWRLGLAGTALNLRISQNCCIQGELLLRLHPGFGRLVVELPATRAATAQWPAAWLAGLGTPWNTLQLQGQVDLASDGLSIESVHGRWRVTGRAQIGLRDISSRLSTLDALGSYRLTLQGNPGAGDAATLQLETVSGALQLSGNGQWNDGKMRFRGEAHAAEGAETVLNNLLNIIGRRQGALSVISIG